MIAANKGAELAELISVTQAPRGDPCNPLGPRGFESRVALPRRRFNIGSKPIGIKRARQQIIDRHALAGDLPRESSDKSGQP
jgi:hypothetical protein